MLSSRFLGAILLISLGFASPTPKCSMPHDAYPPSLNPLPDGTAKNVSWTTVDLDAPANTRWTHVVAPLKGQIRDMLDVVEGTFKDLLGESRVNATLAALDAHLDRYAAALPEGYGDEIKGIGAATGLRPALIFVYNIFYSVLGGCTSIVAQDGHGDVYHARNLDFGLWPALEFKNGSFWKLATKLRPLVVNLDMQRNGTTLYKHTTYSGFIGVHTAVKPGLFSVTLNTRFDNHFDATLIRWLLNPMDGHLDSTMVLRKMIESSEDYESAHAMLNEAEFLGPGYAILGGVKPGQGAVFTKGAQSLLKPDGQTIDVMELSAALANGSSYVLQTNYDNWKPAPFFDDRRDPGKLCMDEIGANGTNFEGLFNVLNGMPNLNRLTTFTTLMHVRTGRLESYRQLCDKLDCPLF